LAAAAAAAARAMVASVSGGSSKSVDATKVPVSVLKRGKDRRWRPSTRFALNDASAVIFRRQGCSGDCAATTIAFLARDTVDAAIVVAATIVDTAPIVAVKGTG
jgi:hypothetical protein